MRGFRKGAMLGVEEEGKGGEQVEAREVEVGDLGGVGEVGAVDGEEEV